MRTATAVVTCIAIVGGLALAENPKTDLPPAQTPNTEKPRALDLYLSQNLVRIANVRYSRTVDAVAALKRNRIASVRVLVCPLTHRENVDKLVDALVAADIGVSQAKVVESREYRCADNARVETRTGT